MLLAVRQCLSQSKWLRFQDEPQKLIDCHAIDKESRGPLKGAQLPFYIKGRLFLEYTGVIIVLGSVAMEPFTHHVLSHPLTFFNVMDWTKT